LIPRAQLTNPRFYLILGSDLALFVLAHVGAYLIRFEFHISTYELGNMIQTLPLIVLFKGGVFVTFGIYRGMWRYVSMKDMWNLFRAVVFSSFVIFVIIVFIHRFIGMSRGVFVIDCGLTFLFTGGLRMVIRTIYHKHLFAKNGSSSGLEKGKKTPALIMGAGDAGEKALREVLENRQLPYEVFGFVDDDPGKKGRTIHGKYVLGNLELLPEIAEAKGVEELLIAIPSATGPQMRRIVEACEDTNLRFKTLPGMGEIIDGKISIKTLRDVDYQDLLGRRSVKMNREEIGGYLKDKRVLITGAGGSIGSELCRQIASFHPELLLFLDVSETNLYEIEMEFEHRFSYLRNVTVLGSIQNLSIIDKVFDRYQPQVIFHAAAYKHVPMLERHPWQAVQNNIRGTQVVMELAQSYGSERFVFVSTDKAVKPTSVMGASKRVGELQLQSFPKQSGLMMSVRFGNVVASSGSVIPLFRKQIARGGPVTVTHPEVMRYFMTIPEACQLILQAGAVGKGGEVFVLDMGTPIRIQDMARDLIRLSGKEPEKDIEIVFTGLRPGEKLYEELMTEGEGICPTDHKEILVLQHDGSWNGHGSQEKFREWLQQGIEELYGLAAAYDGEGIKKKLKQLVPDYTVHEKGSL